MAPGSQAARDFLNAHDEALPDAGDLAQAASGQNDDSTPEAAAQSFRSQLAESLKAQRVGAAGAERVGMPEAATVVPEALTQQEAQQVRSALETPGGMESIKQPGVAAHVTALSNIYSDQIKGLASDASDLLDRAKNGEDISGDFPSIQNRAAAFIQSYANLPGAYSDAARAVEMGSPMRPENAIAAQGARVIAEQLDTMRNPSDLLESLAKLTPEGAVKEMRQIGETIQSGGSIVNDGISSYYKACLLTSPETYVRIPIDNAITTLMEIPTRAMAGVFSSVEQTLGIGGTGPRATSACVSRCTC